MTFLTKKMIIRLLMCTILGVVLAIGCNSGGGGNGDIITPPEDDPAQSENRILNGVRENTVPVGLSVFALGVPNKFPLEDNQQIDSIGFKVVARAVRRIATNEVFTFPETPDPEQVFETLKFFIDNGHQITHQIHILNGPGMRRATDWFVNEAAGRRLYDEEFIDLLYASNDFRIKVLNKFAEVVRHAKRLESIGVDVYICPELEDNHSVGDSGSFGILLDFLRAAGWTNPDGSLRRDKVIRNGGSVGRIQGIRYEKHPHNRQEFEHAVNSLRPGDFINTDGASFSFHDEDYPSPVIPEEDIRYMIKKSEEKNIIFYFWRAELQGYKYVGNGHHQIHPAYRDRYYILDNPKDVIGMLLRIPGSEVQVAE